MRVSYMVWLIFLAVISWQDYREKKISMPVLAAVACIGTGIQIFEKSAGLGSWIGGIFLGAIMLGAAFLTEESIGYGDGWLILVMGMCLGFWGSLVSMLMAFGASALFGGWLMAFRKVKKGYRIPFAPFLFFGSLVYCLMGGVG